MNATAQQFVAVCCSELGYGDVPAFTTKAGTFTQQDIATAVSASFLKHRSELPGIVIGGKRHAYEKSLKRREKEAERLAILDVAPQVGIEPETVLNVFTVLIAFILGGPVGALLAIVGMVIKWWITSEISHRYTEQQLVVAAEAL